MVPSIDNVDCSVYNRVVAPCMYGCWYVVVMGGECRLSKHVIDICRFVMCLYM